MNAQTPSQSEMFQVFGRIGLLSFGGPAAQIALMHKELVDERKWLSEDQYLSALSFCMLLPGPEAMQLATYAGWRLKGTSGGLLAGLLFVLPGAFIMLALSMTYAYFGAVPLVQALFLGIKATVVIVVLQALLKVAGKALKNRLQWIIAGLSFIAIFALAVPFPLIIFLAGVWGWLQAKSSAQASGAKAPPTVDWRSTLGTIAVWLSIWLLPIVVLWAADAVFLSRIATFFSTLAVVTFGGAYAVLAYMAQAVVTSEGWLSAAQMMDGLGLAETTPGPLILVTQFVGFMAGFQIGGLPTALAATAITLLVTFVPCFLWIFVGAPYLDWISQQPRLTAALSAITAAVVGVILNLSIWFALHVFFNQLKTLDFGPISAVWPIWSQINIAALILAIIAGFLLLRLKVRLVIVLGIMALLGGIAGQF